MNEEFEKIFRKDSGALWYGFIRTGCPGLPQLCTTLDAPDTRLFKDREKICAGQVGEFFVKRHNLPGFVNQFRSYFKSPRPFKVLHGTDTVKKSGFSAPEVCAALVTLQGISRRDYLVTRMIGKDETFLNTLMREGKYDEVRQFLLEKFVPALRRLHDNGAMHGDLSLRNLYRDSGGNAGVIDLDGMKHFSHPLSGKLRIVEIARLISSFHMNLPRPENIREDLVVPEKSISQILDAYAYDIAPGDVSIVVQKFIRRGRKYL